MSSDAVIRVSGLGKGFRAYDHPSHRLKQSLYNFIAQIAPAPGLRAKFRERAQEAARTFWALRDIDLEVRRGETVGIIGRNGSGKSTLLQIICGTLSPTEGLIQTHGRIAALLELGSGFDTEFTGRENVYMNGQLHGLSKAQIDQRFDDIEAFADIGKFIDQPVKTYSSGMFVRLAFAVIAHVDADILIVDEALAVGDAFFTQKCMRFLRKFMQTGTILFVSHDSSAIRSLCTKAVWIDRGSLIESGDPKDVCNRYLEAYYEAQQGKRRIDSKVEPLPTAVDGARKDQRKKFTHKPLIEFTNFVFDPSAAGDQNGAAIIVAAQLIKEDGSPMSWTVGGEIVTLRISAKIIGHVGQPVIGFSVKDRLGRMLFGDNTFWITRDKSFESSGQETMTADFTFAMPILTPGDYAIDVAIADASRSSQQVSHWQHEACFFKSEAATSSTGLVGLPMSEASLTLRHTETP
ncbi:lipopolysaccharide transport system ATP-binding protein [Paraburkholderia sp. BL6669N2]|uniref:ABC transporter ATP-binding protein n=1 Tax=Paraburkholderia sp. BL6669N2 TaxID=1938807 RepID=UPI000E235E33|nr:ABC transporter ATP-binding protein [Paraburkholderia sp. BL6669N2]REG61251.1 lipopolysaccharide transport system ATP-binding protein [Paraburkholderia sp. BL6669N2]